MAGVGARRLVVEGIELFDHLAGLRELAEIDLATSHEVEDDLTQVGEGILAPSVRPPLRPEVVEPRPALLGPP